MALTIVAHIKAKPDQIDFVKAELTKLIDITRAEEGCINYDLHWDNIEQQHFMLYENWGSWQLWQNHRYNDHMKAFREATGEAIEEFVVHEMSQIE